MTELFPSISQGRGTPDPAKGATSAGPTPLSILPISNSCMQDDTHCSNTHSLLRTHTLSLSPSLRDSPIVHEGTWGGGRCSRMLQAGPLPCSPAHPLHAPPSQAWPFAAHQPDAAFPQPGQNGGTELGWWVRTWGKKNGRTYQLTETPLPWHSLRAVRWSPTLATKPRLPIG